MAWIEEAEEGGRKWQKDSKAELRYDQHGYGNWIALSYFSSFSRSRPRQHGDRRVRSSWVRGDVLVAQIHNDHCLLYGSDRRGDIRGLHCRSAVHLSLVSPHLRGRKHQDVRRLSEQLVSGDVSAFCDSQKAQMLRPIRSM